MYSNHWEGTKAKFNTGQRGARVHSQCRNFAIQPR